MTHVNRLKVYWGIALCGLLISAALPARAADEPGNGVWKFAPAQTSIHAEFNGEDAVGLAAGAHLKTDLLDKFDR
jgi:hypothetical protein